MQRDYFVEHENKPDLNIMYREMVQCNAKDRERISGIVSKRKARQDKEEDIRDKWYSLTDQERCDKIDQLLEACKSLIRTHPDFKKFKTVSISIEDGVCKLHWNGNKPDQVSGFHIIDREFPEHDIPIVTTRYADKERKHESDDEI